MQSQHTGRFAAVKVTGDGIADVLTQRVQGVGFGEQGLAQSAGGIAAFRVGFYK